MHSRVEMMRAYAETTGCRRQLLLAYFGQTLDSPCGNCDTGSSPFPLQSKVSHVTWGEGVVMRYEGDRIVVLFEGVGHRTLSPEAVAAHGPLEPLEATA